MIVSVIAAASCVPLSWSPEAVASLASRSCTLMRKSDSILESVVSMKRLGLGETGQLTRAD